MIFCWLFVPESFIANLAKPPLCTMACLVMLYDIWRCLKRFSACRTLVRNGFVLPSSPYLSFNSSVDVVFFYGILWRNLFQIRWFFVKLHLQRSKSSHDTIQYKRSLEITTLRCLLISEGLIVTLLSHFAKMFSSNFLYMSRWNLIFRNSWSSESLGSRRLTFDNDISIFLKHTMDVFVDSYNSYSFLFLFSLYL